MAVRVVRYHRVSTDEQNLERQATATAEYVERVFNDPETDTLADASTGTDTERMMYQDIMSRLDEIDAVVVKSVSRIARSIRDLDRTASQLEGNGVELHIIDEGLVMKPGESDPYQKALMQMLGVFAELEANMIQKRVKEGIAAAQENDEYHHGPAPLGYDKNDGTLIQGPQYDQVCAVLDMVNNEEMSKRQAAKRLDTSRSTVRRAINERGELYGL
jgi:DNA invertase Pin-like site-specific DNA recombinase